MKKSFWIFAALIFAFILIRLPGLSLPYHQDEYKTAAAASGGAVAAGQAFAHPPLTQILYRIAAGTFGSGGMRGFILCFAVLEASLLYFVVRRRAGERAALFSLFLFTICAYSIHASLMLDTDGAILPFFYLLALYFYDSFQAGVGKKKYVFGSLLLATLIAGFLVKLSFVLVIGAIALDFLWQYRNHLTKRRIIYAGLSLFGFFALALALIIIIRDLYPVFNSDAMVAHALSFMHLAGRGYMQTLIQALKACFYLSPLLILPILFVDRDVFQKTRVLFIHLALGFLFYFVLFDFSSGALDKYLMFAVIPLSAICGVALARIISAQDLARNKIAVISGVILGALLFAINFLPHMALALYPKSAWFANVLHLKWNMLLPFTGGSGPLGFYVSFLFIIIAFFISAAIAAIALYKKEWRESMMIVLVIFCLFYNVIFAEEYLFGRIFGSAPAALNGAIAFIKSSPEIKGIITYSDAGAYDLYRMGKYAGRFYAVPGYEESHRVLFADHRDSVYFLVVDMPKLWEPSFYKTFFDSCVVVFQDRSGEIPAYVYDCRAIKK
ncbi:MAG: glycosyltransferase family 39 protein [Patescibacteria group bacterium]